MSEENEKLARTTCGVLDYKHMKNTIMKIFGDPCGSEGNEKVEALPIKEECLFGTGRDKKNNEERRYRKGKTDRYRRTDGYDKRTDGHDTRDISEHN